VISTDSYSTNNGTKSLGYSVPAHALKREHREHA
jgi:hypothetical protein